MDLLAFIMALKAQGMTAAKITEAVNEYLEDHPDALDQAAVEAIVGEALSVMDNELSSVKSALTNVNNSIMKITGNKVIEFSDFASKKYLNTSGSTVNFDSLSTASVNVKFAIVRCSPGDQFIISGKGGNADRLYAFTDSTTPEHNIISSPKAGAGATADGLLITAPTNAAYLVINTETDKDSFCGGEFLINDVSNIKETLELVTSLSKETPYENISSKVLKTDGSMESASGITVDKYTNINGKAIYINGEGGFQTQYGNCYVWFVSNGEMVSYIAATVIPQKFNYQRITVEDGIDEIWICHGSSSIDLYSRTARDAYSREKIAIIEDEISSGSIIGTQWNGKSWYAYGTSLTNISSEGKYAKYVRDFSGLVLTNKGISGGGICNNTQIKNAVMNTTDGKLNADLITLEVGSNDTTAPLGTIYDTGNDTFCGALNQCIRYLQANTSAQIVVISSTNGRKNSGGVSAAPEVTYGPDNHTKFDQWEATRKVCEINSCYYIPMGESANMSWARMNASNLYNVDNIHHTELGGYNLGLFVWYCLRNIPLWFAEMPT